MSDVQRYEASLTRDRFMEPYANGAWMLHTDHARIVAEMEQAHAAALAAFERLPGHTAHAYIETSDWSGGQSAQVRFQQSEQGRWVDKGDVLTLLGNAAAAPRTLTSDCLHLAEMYVGQSSRDNEYGRRSPVIECLACGALRLDDETVPPNRLAGGDFDTSGQPRTLTANDPGYHSQRCLHCDHIRATHTLTAHGCIGHALPGRPGADCPCAEFIHDGGAA